MKQKAFFNIFKGLLVVSNCIRPESGSLKRTLVQGKYHRRTRLVTHSPCTTRLVTRSICLPTHSTRLPTRSTRLSTRSTRLTTRSTRLSIRLSNGSTRLSSCSMCVSTRSTCSTICRFYYN